MLPAFSIARDKKVNFEYLISFPTSLNRKPVVAIPLPKVKSVVADANLTSNAVPSSCSTTVTPACLQAMYGIPTTLATQSSNKIAVTGYIDQYPQKVT